MSPKSSLQASDERILQFVDHIKEVMTRITKPAFQEAADLTGLATGFDTRERIDPATFHRMGNLLYEQKIPTMGEISQSLSVPVSTATRMANWWVDNGYAQRLPDPDDRRVVRLSLTEKGELLLSSIEDNLIRNVQRLLSCLTPEEHVTAFGV